MLCSALGDAAGSGAINSTGGGLTVDWERRRQQRVVNDLVEVSLA
jgi:hypothetical protein